MVPVLFLLHVITLFLWSMSTIAAQPVASEAVPIAKPDCTSYCGRVQIPYPFGIEAGCYIDDWFKIHCDIPTGEFAGQPIAYLNPANLNLVVLNISLGEGTIQVTTNFTSSSLGCVDKRTAVLPPNLSGSPFLYSKKNKLTVIGCGGYTWMMLSNGSNVGGCLATCDGSDPAQLEFLDGCTGINSCCQTNIPPNLTAFNYSYSIIDTTYPGNDSCKKAFLVTPDWAGFSSGGMVSIKQLDIPMWLDWRLVRGTADWANNSGTTCNASLCSCSSGFQGNPYLPNGCQDILKSPDRQPVILAITVVGSVLGALLILICAWGLHNVIKKRKNTKRKEKFFKQNGGLLLEKQSSGDVNVEKIKLFNSEELEKATDNYNVNRILGEGGHGTVYKGMLADGSIVAIKKSKIVDEGEVEQFVNEIVILSQIIHRNVVKLMGCCLETEVPLLVYEFILNGTLSQYIHHQNEEFPLTWGVRLRVSIEVAGALSYLHSATSFPIYHRDIKTSNILLDDKFRAKVADFGTSRTVAIDKTHLTMSQVQGTFGYLDPEYFQSSQFTDKSDVYSFGVVLVELLTGQKPVSQTRPEEWRSLTNYFLLSMEENRLLEILDARVMNEGGKEEIMAVAQLARRCLNMKGKKRPTMKEVAVQLEGIFQLSAKDSDVHTNSAEVEYVLNGWHVGSTSAQYNTIPIGSGSPSDVEPLLFLETV
ncbi:wall-associated receptor kinase-like 22 [Rosa sericea]